MHALSHPLGALYDAHHGLLNAILMPYVLEANRAAVRDKLARAACYLGLASASFDGFLEWVLDLRRVIGIPHNLSDIGIGEDRLDTIGRMAIADPSASGNPVQFTADEYAELCRRAVRGKL